MDTVIQLKEQVEEFLIYIDIEKNLSVHTQRAYTNDLKQFFNFWHTLNTQHHKELPIKHIFERYLIHMFNKNFNKSSIARKISCFASLEKFLKRSGVELGFKLTRPRLDKKLPVTLSIDEITYLIDTISDNDLPSQRPFRDKAIFELMYATGIRCSELVSIKLCDIDI